MTNRIIKFRCWWQDKMWLVDAIEFLGKDLYQIKSFDGKDAEGTRFGVKGQFLMQFTGLLDKNGKEIYESDILLYKKPSKVKGGEFVNHYWEVFFGDRGQWKIRRMGIKQALFGHHATHEVVGTVFENPSLLTPKES